MVAGFKKEKKKKEKNGKRKPSLLFLHLHYQVIWRIKNIDKFS